MKIEKTFKSETSHIVRNAVSSRCAYNSHGHSYQYQVVIEGPVNNDTGMILDFKELKPIKEFIDKFDHASVLWERESKEFKDFFLKEFKRVIIMKKNCTAECMASLIHKFTQDWLDEAHSLPDFHPYKCVEVRVHETETGCAIADSSDENDVCVYLHEDKD